ncbi:MAG TPA: tetratricopeptide repeat protein [Acidiferrobacterales bacterium]|nr:tetratricopeptide repeat protein [Acidiferrobacterales bacterium]
MMPVLDRVRFDARSIRACLVGGIIGAVAFVHPAVARAYDFKKIEAAIETLTPATQRNWEQKAAGGDAIAQNVTGMAYKYGIGVSQDHAASMKWFRMAAEQGEADAQFNLARIHESKADGLYRRARAVPANDGEAFKWYRLSAEQGHTQAQVKLAEMYTQGGPPVPHDPVQAHKWLSIAASSGDETAAKRLATYAAGMTPKQVREADSLAQEWNSRHRSD